MAVNVADLEHYRGVVDIEGGLGFVVDWGYTSTLRPQVGVQYAQNGPTRWWPLRDVRWATRDEVLKEYPGVGHTETYAEEASW